MNRISCFRDDNFNALKFNFEKEETETAYSHAALLTKMHRLHRITKCKANFGRLKENTKHYGNRVFNNQNTAR